MGKEVIDVTVLDATIDQMIDWAAGIGAGKPKLAVMILASLYNDRDWDSDDAPNFEMFVESQNEDFTKRGLDLGTTPPHDLFEVSRFGAHSKKPVPYQVLSDPKLREILETTFAGALLFGLSHSDEFESWYENQLVEFNSNRATYEKAGLEMDDLPTLQDYYSNAEDVINLYVQETGKELPMPKPKLLDMVKRIR